MLIFVVAYDAERHIEVVLERLPAWIFDHRRYHLLIIDDSSRDESARRAVDWLEARGVENATVLRNPENLGYGGNQKLGYRYAVDRGFDFVVLLHGDGQYAPELVPRFVEAYDRSGADVVLGSRMHSLRSAARGGMPLHKILGNRALTWFQNRLTGRRLDEYHTGFRGYSTTFLSRIPFDLNTNDFHFDTEILLQACHIEAQIVELPIPTHYGDEVCHVNGLRYALNVTRATLRYRLHSLGVHCSLKFRDLSPEPHVERAWVPYASDLRALDMVRELAPQSLLDIGCGAGHLARQCEALGVEVTGVDRRPAMPGSMTRFLEWDLERGRLPVDPLDFDAILLLDVVEHLADPEGFLVALRQGGEGRGRDSPRPVVVLTTPNVAFIGVRLNLLLGRFPYADRGILHVSHRRLFTRRSLRSMLEDCGFEVDRIEGIGVPFEAVLGGSPGRLLGAVARLFAQLWTSLFAFQLLVVSRPRRGVQALLLETEKLLGEEQPGKADAKPEAAAPGEGEYGGPQAAGLEPRVPARSLRG